MKPRYFAPFVLAIVIQLVGARAVRAEPDRRVDAYLDGELISIHLRRMPEHAGEILITNSDAVGRFFNGVAWECYFIGDIGVCFQHPTTVVLQESRDRPLVQSVEIFFSPGHPWRLLASWAQIEEAIANGEIALSVKDEVYRIAFPPSNGRSSAGKTATSETSWGSIKTLFR